jgi:hypothetical protein
LDRGEKMNNKPTTNDIIFLELTREIEDLNEKLKGLLRERNTLIHEITVGTAEPIGMVPEHAWFSVEEAMPESNPNAVLLLHEPSYARPYVGIYVAEFLTPTLQGFLHPTHWMWIKAPEDG